MYEDFVRHRDAGLWWPAAAALPRCSTYSITRARDFRGCVASLRRRGVSFQVLAARRANGAGKSVLWACRSYVCAAIDSDTPTAGRRSLLRGANEFSRLVCDDRYRVQSVELGLLVGLGYIWYSGYGEFRPEDGRHRFAITSGERGLNPNMYAQILCCYALLAIRTLWSELENWPRNRVRILVTATLCFLTSLYAVYEDLVNAGSRKGHLLAILIAITLFVMAAEGRPFRFFRYPSGRKALGAIAVVGTFLFVAYMGFVESAFTDRLKYVYQFLNGRHVAERSLLERSTLMNAAVRLWLEHPFFGSGVEGFARKSGYGVYCHSNPLELLANYGLVGAGAFYSIHLYIWRRNASVRRIAMRRRVSRHIRDVAWIGLVLASLLILDAAAVTYYEKTPMIMLGVASRLEVSARNWEQCPRMDGGFPVEQARV